MEIFKDFRLSKENLVWLLKAQLALAMILSGCGVNALAQEIEQSDPVRDAFLPNKTDSFVTDIIYEYCADPTHVDDCSIAGKQFDYSAPLLVKKGSFPVNHPDSDSTIELSVRTEGSPEQDCSGGKDLETIGTPWHTRPWNLDTNLNGILDDTDALINQACARLIE